MSSEEKARSLYGEAPEGDEAVDASREVPDPGESRSYASITQPISVLALNGYHLGRRCTVHDGTNYVSGVLAKITHGASIIEEHTLGGGENHALGRRWVQVDFLGNLGARVSPDATVEFI